MLPVAGLFRHFRFALAVALFLFCMDCDRSLHRI